LSEHNLKQKVIQSLQTVFDPEMPSINVYDLGLIYSIQIHKKHVKIQHTLTSMACPFADEICQNIQDAVINTKGVKSVDRQLVFDPPFTIEMVPEETRLIMGWY